MPAAPIARVLLDSPLPQLDRLFDYRIPDELRDAAVPGVRVKVPLRSAGRVADGLLVEIAEQGDYTGVLSDLDSVVSPVRVLTPEVWSLARRAADRAAGSASDIVRLAVPSRQVRVEKAYLSALSAASELSTVSEAPTVSAVSTSPAVSTVSAVSTSPAVSTVPALSAVPSVPRPSEVSASGAVTPPSQPPVLPATAPIEHYGRGVIEAALALNERLAVDAVPRVAELPDGTWVGAWAVTMAAAATSVIAAGRSAILAVPDYRDQKQLAAALRATLPAESVVHLDARQSNPDRYREFLRCLSGAPLAIIGNRSVVYAPASNLGLIAIWDDGDPLHSEPLSPYVHTRDAALLRQELQGCALAFFGHARSTEVERLVEIGWLRSISPTPLVLPKIIPTAQQASGDRLAAQARIPSSAWNAARMALQSGPVLVQVARPGYAPRLACADCNQTARCLRCEGPLAQRSARSVPACAWCGALAASWHCTNCDGDRLKFVGNGSARTAEDLGRAFPGVRVIVADGEHQVLDVGPEPALVIATRGAEPVAAGGYRAVLLLDGEQMVARESLRVGEDCLRWWSNAVALAAGGAPTVLVGVGGALASALVTWRHADYARAELADRRRLRFPPAVRVATVTGTVDAVSAVVAAVGAEDGIDPADVLGPVEVGQPALVRTILRFDYARGAAVATTLRAQLIKAATSRRRPPGKSGVPARGPGSANLRIRLDDVEPFLDS